MINTNFSNLVQFYEFQNFYIEACLISATSLYLVYTYYILLVNPYYILFVYPYNILLDYPSYILLVCPYYILLVYPYIYPPCLSLLYPPCQSLLNPPCLSLNIAFLSIPTISSLSIPTYILLVYPYYVLLVYPYYILLVYPYIYPLLVLNPCLLPNLLLGIKSVSRQSRIYYICGLCSEKNKLRISIVFNDHIFWTINLELCENTGVESLEIWTDRSCFKFILAMFCPQID